MKFTREVQNNEFIITNKEGKQVKVEVSSYNNFGKGVSLYGNRDAQFREYMQMTCEGEVYTWPRVKSIKYDEEADLLLFQDYIEIYDEYNDFDEPFITEIYFYVDFEGRIITDAYSPILNKYYPLEVDKDIPRCPWLEKSCTPQEIFYRRYSEVKEDIGWKIIFLLEKIKKNMKQKLLNKK